MPKHIHYLVILVLIEHAQYSLQNFDFKTPNQYIFFKARNQFAGRKVFLSFTTYRPVLGPPLPPVHSVALSLRVKKMGSKADHSLPESRVKNEWSCTSSPPSYFCFVKRESLLFIKP